MKLSQKIGSFFSKAEPLPAPQSSDDIKNHITLHLAKSLSIPPESLDPNRPFSELGFDSMQAVQFSAHLEDWLKIKLSPTLMWEFPNVNELTEKLAQEVNILPSPESYTSSASAGL